MAKNRILIVDDEPEMVKTLSSIFRARNYRVSIASGGAEGLEKARSERPDLILLGTEMPDIDGYGVCMQLKSDRVTGSIPVIMISADGGSESVLKARTCGASDFIVKPFNLVTLLNKLRKFLVE